ncbi:MAG: sulfatase [Opitutales bacterium]
MNSTRLKTLILSCLITGAAILGVCAILMGTPAMMAQAGSGPERPNILFINVDDLGWTDLGFMGSTYYETPHIDQLAAEGMIFKNAYAPAANCAPSRAVVFTGQYGPRHGVYTVGNSDRGQARFRQLVPTPNMLYIEEENLTFVSLLKDAGYATCHIGKWHISGDPLKHGFETNIGGWEFGHPRGGYFSPYRNPALADGPEGEYLTDRITEEAIGYLEGLDQQRPFFLSMQFYTVHTPLQAKSETVAKYEAKLPTANHFNPVYAAMIEHMDTSVGRLLGTLDDLGIRDNTMILFTSDNGGIYEVSRQSPLRGEKGSYYEGGIREPMVIRWPGRVSPGSRSDAPVSGVDFYPTFLEVAGIEPPEDKVLDGVSLIPLVTETDTIPERALHWHFPVYLQAYGQGNVETRDLLFRTRPGAVMRLGRWKLHEYFEDGALELYDLHADIGERQNLSEILPEKTEELHGLMKDWREKTGAPVPTERNPRYDAEAEAREVRTRFLQE